MEAPVSGLRSRLHRVLFSPRQFGIAQLPAIHDVSGPAMELSLLRQRVSSSASSGDSAARQWRKEIEVKSLLDSDNNRGRIYTFEEVGRRVAHLSSVFHQRRLDSLSSSSSPSSCAGPIAISVEEGIHLAFAQLAAVSVGLVFIPLHYADPPARRAQLLKILKPSLVVEAAMVQDTLDKPLDDLPEVNNNHLMSDSTAAAAAAAVSNDDISSANTVTSPSEMMYYMFTSGTTKGVPKCVAFKASQLEAYLKSILPWIETSLLDDKKKENSTELIDEGDDFPPPPASQTTLLQQRRILLASAPTFDPSIADIFGSILSGSCLLVAKRSILDTDLSSVLVAGRPSSVVSTPALWRLMTDADAQFVEQHYHSATTTSSTTDLTTTASGSRDGQQQQQQQHFDGSSASATTTGSRNRSSPSLVLQVFLGGEPLPSSLAHSWMEKVLLYNIYGVTEAVVYQAVIPVTSETIDQALTCVGIPLGPSIKLQLREVPGGGHDKDGRREPEQELVLIGEQVGEGYVESDGGFNGEFSTGDIVREEKVQISQSCAKVYLPKEIVQEDDRVSSTSSGDDHNGQSATTTATVYRFIGRKDFQIKINGQRTSLEELEAALQLALGPKLCKRCVFSLASRSVSPKEAEEESSGSRAAATTAIKKKQFVVLTIQLSETFPLLCTNDQVDLITRTIRAIADVGLPQHTRPAHIFFAQEEEAGCQGTMDGLPLVELTLTNNGKVDRSRLVSSIEVTLNNSNTIDFEGGFSRGKESDKLERLLGEFPVVAAAKDIWSKVLGCQIRGSSHFGALGGDSLAAQRVSRLLFIAAKGSDDGIPTFGDIPGAFNSIHLLKHPVFKEYAEVLVNELGEDQSAGAQRIGEEREDEDDNDEEEDGDRAQRKKSEVPTKRPRGGYQLPQNISLTTREQLLLDAAGSLKLFHNHTSKESDTDISDHSSSLPTATTPSIVLMECLLQNKVEDINVSCSRHRPVATPLHIAASVGDLQMTRLLLQSGAHPTNFNSEHVTPGHLAAQHSVQCLSILLNPPECLRSDGRAGKGEEVLVQKEGDQTPAGVAAVRSSPQPKSVALPVAVRDGRMQTLLHYAARSGYVEGVKFLLKVGEANAVTRDRWQRTPLHWAIVNDHLDAAKVLLDHQRKNNCSSFQKWSTATTAGELGETVEGKTVMDNGENKDNVGTSANEKHFSKRQPPKQKSEEKQRNAHIRLAKRRTNLPYESPQELAVRLYGPDSEMAQMFDAPTGTEDGGGEGTKMVQ